MSLFDRHSDWLCRTAEQEFGEDSGAESADSQETTKSAATPERSPARDESQSHSAPQSPVLCAVRRIAPAAAAGSRGSGFAQRQGGGFGGGANTFALRRLTQTLPPNTGPASPPRTKRIVSAQELPPATGGLGGASAAAGALRQSTEITQTAPRSAAPLPLTEEELLFLISASMVDASLPDFCEEASYPPSRQNHRPPVTHIAGLLHAPPSTATVAGCTVKRPLARPPHQHPSHFVGFTPPTEREPHSPGHASDEARRRGTPQHLVRPAAIALRRGPVRAGGPGNPRVVEQLRARRGSASRQLSMCPGIASAASCAQRV
ncbi:hypothetical protein T484DRAFT_1744453 [Baffinella frigidus]|nr:hypothetical protein T484DRAFT_1744453 [Cryptophyta sp. CCMP2293]